MSLSRQSKERLIMTLNAIQDDPASWNQSDWHCGTTHCFAGHADLLAGNKPVFRDDGFLDREWVNGTAERATEWLGINTPDANALFDGSMSFHKLFSIVTNLTRDDQPMFDSPADYPRLSLDGDKS